MAPAPTRHPSKWLKARISAGPSTVTPGPKTTCGPTRVVGAQHRVRGQEHRLRRGQRGPARHGRLAQALLHHGLGRREFGARVDAAQFLLGRLDGGDGGAVPHGEADQVGQVILALSIVRADGPQPVSQPVRGPAQRAGVAERDRAFRLAGIGPFDDAGDPPVLADQPAVASGIGRAHGHQREPRAIGGARIQQAFEALARDQWIIGEQHGHLAGAKQIGRLPRRMRGAAPFVLGADRVRCGKCRQHVHAGPDDDGDVAEHRLAGGDQVGQHRPAGDGVRRLGQRRFHARAHPGGQDDGGGIGMAWCLGHDEIYRSRLPPVKHSPVTAALRLASSRLAHYRSAPLPRTVAVSLYLVTGGAGFIGSHLSDFLLADGHRVRVLDDLSTGKRANLSPRVELIVGDVADPAAAAAAMAGVAGCFHLAAIASVQRGNEDWIGTSRVNLGGTIAVLDAARAASIPVVYASSAAIYGDLGAATATEDARPAPKTAYGADKLASELHASVAWHVHGVPTLGLRFFNVYGPRQDPASPYSGVISVFADRIAAGAPITLNGDGEQTRDFVHVGDVVAHLRASMRLLAKDGPSGGGVRVLNVCTGRQTAIIDLARLLGRLAGCTPDVRHGPPRAGDIRQSLGDPSRARQHLDISADRQLADGLGSLLHAERTKEKPGEKIAGDRDTP